MKYLLICFCVFIIQSAYPQWSLDMKRDYCWLGGYEWNVNSPRSMIQFGSGVIHSVPINTPISFAFTDASICDQDGSLLFYTNGMHVVDKTHHEMPNGDSLGLSYYYNSWNNPYSSGYRLTQGALILPKPGSPDEYFIIHDKLDLDYNYPGGAIVNELLLSTVNMSLHGGLGDVVLKNFSLIKDTLEWGGITAVRHGNGRDWWIIQAETNNNGYYILLLSPNGIINYGSQAIGNTWTHPGIANAVFSPDGTKYVRCGDPSGILPHHLELFDFDRCSGTLSNPVDLSFPDTAYTCSAAISPNSRYLYFSNALHVFQYDLQSVNIISSKTIVATWDGTYDSIFGLSPVTLDFMQLAPDSKIYISASASDYYSTIEFPDSAGVACGVLQHSIHLASLNYLSIPNFPNYRLFNLPGSVCDSLIYLHTGNPILEISAEMTVYPNPAIDQVTITYNLGSNSKTDLQILNL